MISAQWAWVQDRATLGSSWSLWQALQGLFFFLMLLPDRGHFPLTPRPSHRVVGVIYWLIKPMRETKAKDQPLLLGEGHKMI